MHFVGKIDAKERYRRAVKSAEVGADVISKRGHTIDPGKGRIERIGRRGEPREYQARDNGEISAVHIARIWDTTNDARRLKSLGGTSTRPDYLSG